MLSQEEKTKNRAFQEMEKAALKRLEGQSGEDIARRTGIPFDWQTQTFALTSLGQAVEICFSDFSIAPPLDQWHQLLLLHYLDMADGTALTGELMAFGELPGGMVRGGGFDRQSELTLSGRLGSRPREAVERACLCLGGKLLTSNADVCAVFALFPRYPITLKLWLADEEMPGSGRLFLDRAAEHYLSVEDAVTAGTLLLEGLVRVTDGEV